MRIGNKFIGSEHPVYLIAEIGSNHNQDKTRALEMIEMAALSGADAVKFQSIRFDKLYQPEYESNDFKQWFKAIELEESWYQDLAAKATSCGVHFLSAPTYIEAIDLLEQSNVLAYKIASPQVQGNLALVQRAAQTQKPLIMSLGYSEYKDIHAAIKTAHKESNHQIALLHCISSYPMKAEHANLKFIHTLNKMTGCPIGFSDHSLDDHLTIAAVALGACIIEKHVTLDRNLPGPDHHFAMTFNEFKHMANRIRDISHALGDGVRMRLLDKEYHYRDKVKRKLFSKHALKAGKKLQQKDMLWLRHNSGISEDNNELLLNSLLLNDIESKQLITWNSLKINDPE